MVLVYGTRPEAIKLAPVVTALRRRGVYPRILATGQHTTLLVGTPAETVLEPDVSLGLASDNDPLRYAAVCEAALRARWAREPPTLVIVQGDTASAAAGAMAAAQLGLPLAHIEAGIRTGDLTDPWPEEQFRVAIDAVATQHYCATLENAAHVTAECPTASPVVTGNPGIDALYAHTPPSRDIEGRLLVTLHRRESFGAPLTALVAGLELAAHRYRDRLAIVWPTHPNPAVQAVLSQAPHVSVWPPLEPHTFAGLLATSRAVLTDSGGVQEEAAALGIPCLVAREHTDRPESVAAGLAQVIGRTADGVLDGLTWALNFSTRPPPSACFGDGHAAPRIVDALLTAAG